MRNIFKRRTSIEKMIDVVRNSWNELAKAIATGKIVVKNDKQNEDQIRTEFFRILRNKGLQVVPEYKCQLSQGTHKTATGKAKIDLLLAIAYEEHPAIAIELKHFPKVQGATTTDNRTSILKDVENIEAYIRDNIADVGFCLMYTNDRYYMDDSRSKINIGDCGYQLEWQTYNDEQDCFLAIMVE